MGTRSILRIYRKGKPVICLWSAYDGYFQGAGYEHCKQLKALLEKYTVAQIDAMLDALEIEDIVDGQNYKPWDLIAFIEGKTEYQNMDCDDNEVEYELNMYRQSFSGYGRDWDGNDVEAFLTFQEIKEGKTVLDKLPDDVPDAEDLEPTVDSLLMLNNLLSPEGKLAARNMLEIFNKLSPEDKATALERM